MSDSSIAALSHPGFQQAINSIIGKEFQRVERVLGFCAHESPESYPGACNGGFPCHNHATVCDVRTGEEFCLEHFEGLIL